MEFQFDNYLTTLPIPSVTTCTKMLLSEAATEGSSIYLLLSSQSITELSLRISRSSGGCLLLSRPSFATHSHKAHSCCRCTVPVIRPPNQRSAHAQTQPHHLRGIYMRDNGLVSRNQTILSRLITAWVNVHLEHVRPSSKKSARKLPRDRHRLLDCKGTAKEIIKDENPR